jgi:hypothetical protein
MKAKNFGTMYMGYYYDESRTDIGYNIFIEDVIGIHNVAYHSKGQLIKQLIQSGHKKESIQISRVVYK